MAVQPDLNRLRLVNNALSTGAPRVGHRGGIAFLKWIRTSPCPWSVEKLYTFAVLAAAAATKSLMNRREISWPLFCI